VTSLITYCATSFESGTGKISVHDKGIIKNVKKEKDGN